MCLRRNKRIIGLSALVFQSTIRSFTLGDGLAASIWIIILLISVEMLMTIGYAQSIVPECRSKVPFRIECRPSILTVLQEYRIEQIFCFSAILRPPHGDWSILRRRQVLEYFWCGLPYRVLRSTISWWSPGAQWYIHRCIHFWHWRRLCFGVQFHVRHRDWRFLDLAFTGNVSILARRNIPNLNFWYYLRLSLIFWMLTLRINLKILLANFRTRIWLRFLQIQIIIIRFSIRWLSAHSLRGRTILGLLDRIDAIWTLLSDLLAVYVAGALLFDHQSVQLARALFLYLQILFIPRALLFDL